MKKLFLSLVALTMATMSYAQSSVLATLSHDGEISTYYGIGAYKEAMDVATDGDIITLSSGTFTAIDITKAVTIRGAGMAIDTIARTFPTIISGDFTISIPESATERLTIEGVYSDQEITVDGVLKDAAFLKDRFGRFSYKDVQTTRMQNLTFIHCRISQGLYIPYYYSSASCINSYIGKDLGIGELYYYYSTTSYYELTNCVIRIKYKNSLNSICNSRYQNCIIIDNSDSSFIPSSSTAYYCVGMRSNESNMFCNQTNNTNWNLGNDFTNLFKTYTGEYNDDETFELTDEAIEKYLGSDGKQVGMYGGDLPYNPRPTNPQITKCIVASKSTPDGKLSVDIEVSAAE